MALPLPRLAALERLLARASASHRECADSAQWSCEAFGVERQQDWPVAPLSLLGEGVDPGGDYWLCATPVHMQVRRDHMVLMPPAMLAIAADEAAELVAALEAHFSDDGLALRAPAPSSWYLRCPVRPELTTTSIELAEGRNVDPLLPAGKDRLAFHKLINEVQMLLHGHPVNTRREDAGTPVINSLWLWGGGTLPAAAQKPWERVASFRPLELGLAKLAGTPTGALRGESPARGLYVLPGIPDAEQASMLETVDRDWVHPLLSQLSSGELDDLDLVILTGGQALQWSLKRSDLWKFWRRAQPLDAMLRAAPR